MQAGKTVMVGVWLMIAFNLLLAFGAVWSFQRMSPEIRRVYERNVVSLDACENMLLAMTGGAVDFEAFSEALSAAERNITEEGEKETLARIRSRLAALEKNDGAAKTETIADIKALSLCNKKAIVSSAEKTQRLRRAGAWGIVFTTLVFFMAAAVFEQRLRRTFIVPLKELGAVLEARMRGDRYRRCNGIDASADMKRIFKSVNDLLDSNQQPTTNSRQP